MALIPMNMRDGCLLVIGKGNEDWNYSAPHGAGRILSRIQAKKALSIEQYRNEMKDIYTTCVCEDTIDEAPMVYKPIDEIVKNIQDTAHIIEIIKPIYNFKAKE
jgi:RNA-splicing ligase RtcB